MSDKTVDPFEQLLDDEAESVGVTPPGVGFAPQLGPAPIPAASEDTLCCLRGPCQYYMEVLQRFETGNTIGTLDEEPRMKNRFCLRVEASPIDLTDSCVYECSDWDPTDPLDEEHLAREQRRAKYEASLEEEEETE